MMRYFVWLLAFAAGTAPAAAAEITGFGTTSLPGFSTGTLGPVGLTPAPNNDDVPDPDPSATNPNVIPYSIFYNSLGLTDVEFQLEDSGGTTEYRFTQRLLNLSGQTWSGFRFELGFGVGAAFSASAAGDGLDFDAPALEPSPTSSAFPLLDLTEDALQWSGALLPFVGLSVFTFEVDVPDGLATVNPSGSNRFTLRQFALLPDPEPVPAPATLPLLGAAAAALLVARRGYGRTAGNPFRGALPRT